jgi:hypothetical protein
VQLLRQELAYGRNEHEEWLRGEGRAILSEQRQELLGEEYTLDDEVDFEREVQAQLALFDMCGSVPCSSSSYAALGIGL